MADDEKKELPVTTELNEWYEATTPEGEIWVETYYVSELDERISMYSDPDKLKVERVTQRVEYYPPVRTSMKDD